MSYDIASFVDRLVQEKNFSGLDEAVMAQIKSDLSSRVESRINALILSKLSPDDMEAFEKMLDGNENADEISAFLKKSVPDLEESVAAELLAFRQTYLGL